MDTCLKQVNCFLTRERENTESKEKDSMFAESKSLPIVHSISSYSINCMYCLALLGEEFAVHLKARMWLKEDRSLAAGKLQQVTSSCSQSRSWCH